MVLDVRVLDALVRADESGGLHVVRGTEPVAQEHPAEAYDDIVTGIMRQLGGYKGVLGMKKKKANNSAEAFCHRDLPLGRYKTLGCQKTLGTRRQAARRRQAVTMVKLSTAH